MPFSPFLRLYMCIHLELILSPYPGWLVASDHIWLKSDLAKNSRNKSDLLIVVFEESSFA